MLVMGFDATLNTWPPFVEASFLLPPWSRPGLGPAGSLLTQPIGTAALQRVAAAAAAAGPVGQLHKPASANIGGSVYDVCDLSRAGRGGVPICRGPTERSLSASVVIWGPRGERSGRQN